MLLDSVQKFIANDYDFDTRQKIAESDQGYSQVWQTFAELGWTAIPFAEEDGGIGGGAVDMMVVMEQFGRGLLVEPTSPTWSRGWRIATLPALGRSPTGWSR